MTSQPPPLTLDREMSISHNDFLRVLPSAALQAAGTREYSLAGRKVTIGAGGKKVEITLSKESERRLGAFRFPLTKVSFVFHGYTKAEMEAFLTRFSRAYQRVGG